MTQSNGSLIFSTGVASDTNYFLPNAIFSLNPHILRFSVILRLLGNHHPPVEFDCGRLVLIIRCAFVCVCTRARLCTSPRHCQFPRRLGGWAGSEINDPWSFRCDQQTKLSSQPFENKEIPRGAQRLDARCSGRGAA